MLNVEVGFISMEFVGKTKVCRVEDDASCYVIVVLGKDLMNGVGYSVVVVVLG